MLVGDPELEINIKSYTKYKDGLVGGPAVIELAFFFGRLIPKAHSLALS